MKVRQYLNESSLSRLYKHMLNHDSGTITSFRDEERNDDGEVVLSYTKDENKSRNRVLLAKLKQKYNVTKVKGSYIENMGSKFAKEVGEDVYFVVDNLDRGSLESDLKRLGQEFNQDSIMFIPKGGTKGILHGTKKDEFSGKFAGLQFGEKVVFPKAVWGKENEFMTKIRNRPFTFTESVIDIPPTKGFFSKWGEHALSKQDWRTLVNEN